MSLAAGSLLIPIDIRLYYLLETLTTATCLLAIVAFTNDIRRSNICLYLDTALDACEYRPRGESTSGMEPAIQLKLYEDSWRGKVDANRSAGPRETLQQPL